ncbi:TolC family protein [Pontibacter rufus]|uniref:TolC family protein n=1 Tax=Pontibacter rufus TaxID=2791028 RepID=UPI001E3FDD04|nr:TolC family protein [Pontibacter sp. 172403-2]
MAQTQQPEGKMELTLQEAVKYAIEHNEDVAKANLDQQIGQQIIREAKSNGLPQLSGYGTLDYYPALPTQILPGALAGREEDIAVKFGKDFNSSAGVEFTQMLFSKSYFVGLEAAKSTKDLYRLRAEMAEEDVMYNVGTAYFGVLQTQEQFNNINANLEKLAQLEKILTLQYQNDMVKKVDVSRVTVNITNLQTQKEALLTALEQQKNMLKFFMGMPLDQDINLADATITLDNTAPAAVIPGEISRNRVQLELLQKQKELTGLQASNIKAGYYPSLSAYGRYGYQVQRDDLFSNEQPWYPVSVVGLKLSVPIFDGFRKDAQIKQANLEMQKLDMDIQKFNKNTAVELTNAISQLQNSQHAIAAQKGNVDLAQEVYDTTNKLYKEGISPLTELLDAEVALREAQTNLNNEKLKYQVAQLSYLKAKGDLETLTK